MEFTFIFGGQEIKVGRYISLSARADLRALDTSIFLTQKEYKKSFKYWTVVKVAVNLQLKQTTTTKKCMNLLYFFYLATMVNASRFYLLFFFSKFIIPGKTCFHLVEFCFFNKNKYNEIQNKICHFNTHFFFRDGSSLLAAWNFREF